MPPQQITYAEPARGRQTKQTHCNKSLHPAKPSPDQRVTLEPTESVTSLRTTSGGVTKEQRAVSPPIELPHLVERRCALHQVIFTWNLAGKCEATQSAIAKETRASSGGSQRRSYCIQKCLLRLTQVSARNRICLNFEFHREGKKEF